MWFIFPQMAGLGHSATARYYAVQSRDEAQAYLAHPILGERLRACVAALRACHGKSVEDIFGPIDAMKLRSSLTLFAEATGDPVFSDALDRWFNGDPDHMTIDLLSTAAPAR